MRGVSASQRLDRAAAFICPYEILNALKWSRVYDVGELRQIGVSLNKYGFKTYPLIGELKRETIEIAVRFDATIYDACYVALARHLDTAPYTADQELIRKISLPCIIPISELK